MFTVIPYSASKSATICSYASSCASSSLTHIANDSGFSGASATWSSAASSSPSVDSSTTSVSSSFAGASASSSSPPHAIKNIDITNNNTAVNQNDLRLPICLPP